MILNSETGNGKTLTYLLPIMNELFHYKDSKGVKPNGAKFRMNKENEEKMFKNADEILSIARQNKRLSFKSETDSNPKGAIILSYSKELITQIYVEARKLDLNSRIMITRPTSSLQMKTPIVERIVIILISFILYRL